MIAAIILAAGGSERMGAPKAALSFGDRSFLEHIHQSASIAGLSPVISVVGPDAQKYMPNMDLRSIVVRNDDVESGPISSLARGIRAVFDQPVDAVIAWHVDRPHIKPSTIAALVGRYRAGGALIVVPSHRETRGHPILLGRDVWAEVLLEPAGGLRSVVRSDPRRVATVPVEDAAVLEDIDTPEDYAGLLRGEGPKP